MQHCQFFHKSKIKKGKFTPLGGSSVKDDMIKYDTISWDLMCVQKPTSSNTQNRRVNGKI